MKGGNATKFAVNGTSEHTNIELFSFFFMVEMGFDSLAQVASNGCIVQISSGDPSSAGNSNKSAEILKTKHQPTMIRTIHSIYHCRNPVQAQNSNSLPMTLINYRPFVGGQ